MFVNYRSVLALAATSSALVFIAASGSSVLAVKPVPRTESAECQQARRDYHRCKAEYNRLMRESVRTRNDATRKKALDFKAQALNHRDWYRLNCKETPKPSDQQPRFHGNCTPKPNDVVRNCIWYDWAWESRSGRNLECRDNPEHRRKNPHDCYKVCGCTKRMK
jgi:hypothetical protein